MINPTVGRIVYYWPGGRAHTEDPGRQPLAATIAHVHNERMINIGYLQIDGVARDASCVPLVQDGDERPDAAFCEWMPYQKGQAAKTEQLEAKVETQPAG
ncbi:MAG: hypothetical protein GEU95_01120 [Rhizobiales bacterium]|nr:hypothetical protein [Hyphomicrobiales bacterium]